jgi:urease accessory protein
VTHLGKPPVSNRLQRSNGACWVALGPDGIAELYQSDPCRFFLPPTEPGDLPCGMLLTTSGGIAGGDRLRFEIDWREKTRAAITTSAAEKIYRAGASEAARIDTHLTVADGAHAEWLPQETILFRQSRLERRCRIDLAGDARLLAADMFVLGRAASGERYGEALLQDRWEIRRDGKLVWYDALRLDEENEDALSDPAGFAGAGAFGLLLLAAPEAPALADRARAVLPDGELCGVTVINHILIARWLARDGASLRKWVAAMAGELRSRYGLPARAPRIWQ